MTKREFLDIVFALAPTEANAIMDAFDEYVDSNEPHWIPVTERLPEKNGAYLVTADGFPVSIKFYSADSYGWGEEWRRVIIAWMPLPEPYNAATNGRD